MAVTRINNNQITDASAGNVYLGINANTKLQNYSITSQKIANNLTYGSDLTVSGNLTVNGTSTAIDTTITTIEDPVIVLASTQTGSPTVDIGFLGERGTSDNIAFVWNEANSEFVTAFTSTSETNTTIAISSYANFHTNDANIGGNIVINGTTSLVSNVVGAAAFTGNITAGNLLTPGLISATGNITGGNLSAGSGIIVTTGNINGGNLNATTGITSVTIDATGNINGNNINAVNDLTAEHLRTTGNALIGGNLVVQGNLSYININDLRVEDPIIILGTGPNGAPLTTNDGLDRGIYMEYYTTGTGNAFVGWDNSSGNMIIANDVDFTANDVVGINSYGTLEVGNIYSQSVVSTGNVAGGNLTTAGQVVATGNVNGGNIVTSNTVTGANVIGTSSVTGGNIVISGDDITDTNGRVNFNTAGADVDFAVNGDTVANVFYIDAATGTASFGSATQTTNALVAFNTSTSILAPVGNTAQRPAVGVTGMMRFNSSNNSLEIFDNSAWTAVGVPVFTVIADEQFNGDGVTVAFTLGSTQTTNSCIVSINGVVQIPTLAYAVAGTDPTCVLTFTEAPADGDIIDVRQITTTTTVTSIANSSGNAVVSVSPTSAQTNVTGDLSVSGSILGGNLNSTAITFGTSNMTIVSSGGNIRANIAGTTVQTISPGLVAITGDLSVSGNATLSGNILGDRIQNGTTQIDIQTPNGNANITVAGTSNVAVFSTTGANITGALGVTGNITGSYILGNGSQLTGIDATSIQNGTSSVSVIASGGNVRANIAGATVTTTYASGLAVTGLVSATGAVIAGGDMSLVGNIVDTGPMSIITSSNGNISLLPNGSGNVNIGANIMPTANNVSNIGGVGSTFNTIFARATQAQYADLAEKYTADAEYAPGTVVSFGGTHEVTLSTQDADRRVAGVVSTNPSYIMNGGLEGANVATVALTGRVPTRVTGTVAKGDLMVSNGDGTARSEADPRAGAIIGKALEDFADGTGTIEVVIGRF
jgi:hypothetical protein